MTTGHSVAAEVIDRGILTIHIMKKSFSKDATQVKTIAELIRSNYHFGGGRQRMAFDGPGLDTTASQRCRRYNSPTRRFPFPVQEVHYATPVIALALFAFAGAAAADTPDPKAVITKAIEAQGLKDDGKLLNLSWRALDSLSVGGIKKAYTVDFYFRAPDGLRFDMFFRFMGQRIKYTGVVNGDEVWEAVEVGNVPEPSDKKKEYSKNKVYELSVVSLKSLNHDKAFKLSSVVGKKVGDKPTVGVLVERKDKPIVTLYFDQKTKLLVKSETNVMDEDQGWKEVLQETYYDEYKDANGRNVFAKMRVVRDGKPYIESKMSDVKSPEKFDAKLFEKP